ncbi:hypothetical protein BD408DRAFT_77397 [Parasitella parasitica]|nr:hypothetical protein BD408DRAFT_77397 [Parasitella parasitica]
MSQQIFFLRLVTFVFCQTTFIFFKLTKLISQLYLILSYSNRHVILHYISESKCDMFTYRFV